MKIIAAVAFGVIAVSAVASRKTDWMYALYERHLQEEGISKDAIDKGWQQAKGLPSEQRGWVRISVTPRLTSWPTGNPTHPHINCRSSQMNLLVSSVFSEGELPTAPSSSVNDAVQFECPMPDWGKEGVIEVAAGWDTFIQDAKGLKALPPAPRLLVKMGETFEVESVGGSVSQVQSGQWQVNANDPEAPFELLVTIEQLD